MEAARIDEEAVSRVGNVLRGKWRLERVLGVGGMATVYAAVHRNGMRGAVKILHAGVARDADARERFLREGYLANRVPHGAVKVLDDDTTEDGTPFIVMELLEGSTVDALACSRPGERLEVDEVFGIGSSLLGILVGAHGIGLVHRDIKPENLFLTTNGELRLLDFGIARLREQSGAMRSTSATSIMGTPAFMPPEQALARWDDVGPHSDIYSVGATLFTLLTGQITHEARTAAELLVAVATRQARTTRSLHGGVPAALAEVVDRALAHDPARRWLGAAQMKEALELAARLRSVHSEAGLDEARTVEAISRPAPSSLPRPVDATTATLASARSMTATPDAHLRRRAPTRVGGVDLATVPYQAALSRPGPISFLNEQSDASRAMSKTTSPVSSDHASRSKGARAPLVVGLVAGVLMAAAGTSFFFYRALRPPTPSMQSTGLSQSTPAPSVSSDAPAASLAPQIAPASAEVAVVPAATSAPPVGASAPPSGTARPPPHAPPAKPPAAKPPAAKPPAAKPSSDPPKPNRDLDLTRPD